MSYNSQKNKNTSKKSIYIKKFIDHDIPQNIMRLILQCIDCYNSNIKESTHINMEYETDQKFNDGSFGTCMEKASKSSKKADNEFFKYRKDIISWLATLEDDKLDFFSDKISKYNFFSKKYIILCVDSIRFENKKSPFDPNYKSKIVEDKKVEDKKVEYKKVEYKKVEDKKESGGKILYGDAWDL
jgi:hypothetical protein